MEMALTVPQYTVADLELLPDDGNRYEVIAGTLLVTPSPGSAHQGVSARIAALFADYRGGRFLSPAAPSGPGAAVTMDDLSRITAPTLVIIGDTEVPYLQIVGRALAYAIPNARLQVVPGGGHMVNLFEPSRYNAALVKFLTAPRGRNGG